MSIFKSKKEEVEMKPIIINRIKVKVGQVWEDQHSNPWTIVSTTGLGEYWRVVAVTSSPYVRSQIFLTRNLWSSPVEYEAIRLWRLYDKTKINEEWLKAQEEHASLLKKIEKNKKQKEKLLEMEDKLLKKFEGFR